MSQLHYYVRHSDWITGKSEVNCCERPLVIFAYFCYHPTNESLHFHRLLLLGFLALYSFHQRMVEALA